MSVFGEVCELLAESQTYGHWQMDKVIQTFVPPIAHKQAMVFRNKGKLVALVTWAWVSDQALDELKSGSRRIQLDDWQSGENLFFVDFIAPYGDVPKVMRHVLQRFRNQRKKGLKGHWYRPAKERSGHVVS